MTTASTFSSHNDVGSRAGNTHYWVLKTTNFRCCRSILGYTLGVHVLRPPRERSPVTKLSRSLSLGTHQHFAIDFISSEGRVHSYVEKGCRKKCTRQSRNYISYCGWFLVHCSSKKFERMARKAMDLFLWVLKESNKSKVRWLQCQEHSIDHIPCYVSGLSRAHFFRQPFLK